MNDIVWTTVVVDEFVALGCLTEDEEKILRTRAAGWSRAKQAMTFGMSLSTVDRIMRRLRIKYDRVQIYSPLLPPRGENMTVF